MIRENTIDRMFEIWEKEMPVHYDSTTIRQSQVQMSFDISDFISNENKKKFLLIEAPVGTGKSLGSLIPAMISLKNSFKYSQVQYATSTINLQGQLLRDEVPILKKLNLCRNAIFAKGKAHNFCFEQYEKNCNKLDPGLNNKILIFHGMTSTGHRDELEKLEADIPDSTWDMLSLASSTQNCEYCKNKITCATFRHRSKFRSSDVELLVTNHNQLIQSSINYFEEAKAPILSPSPGIIIIDEAHDFMENYLGQVKEKVTFAILRHFKGKMGKNRTVYSRAIEKLNNLIKKEKEKLESLQGRYKITPEIISILHDLRKYISEALYSTESAKLNRYNASSGGDGLGDTLIAIDSLLSEDKNVSWISYDEEQFCSIKKDFLRSFNTFLRRLAMHNKIIFMSGTLTTNNNFDHLIKLWGMDEKLIITKTYETSFDYREQALMYVPTDMLSVHREADPKYFEKQLQSIRQLTELTAGRTLILNTSRVYMNNIFDGLHEELKRKKINLYIQGQASVESLSEKFKEDIDSVLIGSGSFFSGISVKGRSLESVILTRLPYPVRDDPFIELLQESVDANERFEQVIFPHMMIKLKQAVGRLIRDINDFGIIAILDTRMFSGKNGAQIRTEFEKLGYKITRNFGEVENFYILKQRGPDTRKDKSYSRSSIVISDNLRKENAKYIRTQISEDKAPQLPQFPVIIRVPESERLNEQNKQYIGQRVTISNYTQSIDEPVTSEQNNFATSILQTYSIRCSDVSTITNSYELYKYICDEFLKRFYDLSVIINDFPFICEAQKDIFTKYRGKVKCSQRRKIKKSAAGW